MNKYKNRQFHFSVKDILVVILVMLTTILSLVFYDGYSETKEKYNVSKTSVDYIIQTPSVEQISEFRSMEHINSVVPYYYCACSANVSGKTVKAELYLIEEINQMGNTLFSQELLVKQNQDVSGNVLYLDSVFADKYDVSVGDKLQLMTNGGNIECTVGAVYETDGRHDTGMLMAIYAEQFAEFVNPNGTLKYSGAYLDSSDNAATEAMLKEYVPMGDLRSRDEFESDELYQAYLDLKLSADSTQTTFNKDNYLKEVANRYDAKLTRNSVLMYGITVLGMCLTAVWLLVNSMKYIKKDILKDIRNNFSAEQEKEMIRAYFLFALIFVCIGILASEGVVAFVLGWKYSIGIVVLNVVLPAVAVLISMLVADSKLDKSYYKAMEKYKKEKAKKKEEQ